MPPATLTNIPRKLRDIIIDIVLTSSVPVPKKQTWIIEPNNNCKLKKGDPTTSLPLLLINRQFYAETKEVIGRYLDEDKHQPLLGRRAGRKRRELTYKFDITLIDDTYVWPAQVCVPVLAPRVDNVVVTIQAFGTCPVTKATMTGLNAFKSDMGPTEIHWAFYRPLVKLLREGPRSEMWTSKKPTQHPITEGLLQEGDRDRGITIGVLTLDFQKSTDNTATNDIFYKWMRTEEGHPFQQWKLCRGMPSQKNGSEDVHRIVIRPQWLMRYLFMRLLYVLSMGYHAAQYGSILYERIGRIDVCLNGERVKKIDLAEKLATLSYNHPMFTFGHLPSGDRLDAFWRWKREAFKLRKDRGLPIVYSESSGLNGTSPAEGSV